MKISASKLEELKGMTIRISEVQDAGGDISRWKPEVRRFYRIVRSDVCKDFAPWRDPADPTYHHTICNSGTSAAQRDAFRCADCSGCPLLNCDAAIPAWIARGESHEMQHKSNRARA